MTDTDVLDLYLDDVDVGPPGGLLGGMSDDSTSLGLSSALTQDDPLQQSPFNQMPGIAANAQYDFSQFVTPKFHHISDPSLGGSQNLLGQTPPPHPSLSNSDSLLQSTNQFNNYNISTGQTITTPQQQQQQDLVSNSVWNPPQTNTCFIQTQQVQNQPTEVQQNVAGTVDLNMSSYLTHHDYALPAAQQPLARLSHFPDNTDANQTSILQGSIGQTEATQMLNVPIVNTSGVDALGHIQQSQQQQQQQQTTLFTSTTQVPLAAPDITVNTYNSSQPLHNFQATDYLETHNPQQMLQQVQQQVCNGSTMLNSGTNQQSVGTNDAAVNIVQQYTFQTTAASNSPQLQLQQSQPVSGSQPVSYHTGHSVPQYQATYNVSANILNPSPKTAPAPQQQQQPAPQIPQTELGHLTEPAATYKQNFHPLEQLVTSAMTSKPDNRMVIQASVINNQIGNTVQTAPASNFVPNGFEGTASASVAESPVVTANAPELPQSVSFIFNTVCNTLGPNQSKCLLVQCPPSTQSTNQLQQQQQSLVPETGTQLCVSSPSTSTYNNVVKLQPQHTFSKGRSFHLIHADLQIPQENQSQTTTTVPLSQLLSSGNITRLVPQSTAQQTFTNASCQISTAAKQVTQQIHLTTVSPKQQSGTQPLAKVITSASPAIFTSTRVSSFY